LPHAPQLALSDCSLTHTPPQLVSPVWHERAHAPAEQTWPDGHVLPQAPQLALSVSSFTQVPLQLERPA
jgi:hypothetical protein